MWRHTRVPKDREKRLFQFLHANKGNSKILGNAGKIQGILSGWVTFRLIDLLTEDVSQKQKLMTKYAFLT